MCNGYPSQYDKGGPARAAPLPPGFFGPLLDVARLGRGSARLLGALAEARREAGLARDQERLLALKHSRWGPRLAARWAWPMRVPEPSRPLRIFSTIPRALSPTYSAHILRRLSEEALALQSKADETGKKAEAAEEAWGQIQVGTRRGG